MKPKITIKQFKELTKLEGEMGAEIDSLTNSLKIVKKNYKKMGEILANIRKNTDFE